MTRSGSNEYNAEGILVNGYDYDLQCWVKGSIVQDCGHSREMSCGCYGREHRGQPIENARSAAGLPLRDQLGPGEFLNLVRDDCGPLSQAVTVTNTPGPAVKVTPGRMTCSNGATERRDREPMTPTRSRRDRKRRGQKVEDAMLAIARAQGRADAGNYKPYDRALAILVEIEKVFDLRRKPNK